MDYARTFFGTVAAALLIAALGVLVWLPSRPSGDAERKVARGGSWADRPADAGSSVRRAYQPWQRVYDVGFRVIVEKRGREEPCVSEATVTVRVVGTSRNEGAT